MTDQQHRATPEQWEVIEICKEEGKIPWPTATCILELRDRIAALEATQHTHPEEPDVDHPAPTAKDSLTAPADSLVERVAMALDSSCPQDEYVIKDVCTMIREVAAWMRERGWDLGARALEREAEQLVTTSA
jgi:hypothetical protein